MTKKRAKSFEFQLVNKSPLFSRPKSTKNSPRSDAKIVCLDSDGRSVFNDLLFHRSEPYFFAFDLLWLSGRNLRSLPLIERKQRLRQTIPEPSNQLLYCDHIEENGEGLFELACQHDLEGIVAKRKDGHYTNNGEDSTWVKIRNHSSTWDVTNYSKADRHATVNPLVMAGLAAL